MRYYRIAGSAPRTRTRHPGDDLNHKKGGNSGRGKYRYTMGVLLAGGALADIGQCAENLDELEQLPNQIRFRCSCCIDDTPCDLTNGGTRPGTWDIMRGSGTIVGHNGLTGMTPSTIAKWTNPSPYGNNYLLQSSITIYEPHDKARLLFNYCLEADTFDYIEIEAGDASTGVDGALRLYLGAGMGNPGTLIMEDDTMWIRPGTAFTLDFAAGQALYSDCTSDLITLDQENTLNNVIACIQGYSVATANTAKYNGVVYSDYTVHSSPRSWGVFANPSNDGVVDFDANTAWYKISSVSEYIGYPDTGDCDLSYYPQFPCVNSTAKQKARVTFTTGTTTGFAEIVYWLENKTLELDNTGCGSNGWYFGEFVSGFTFLEFTLVPICCGDDGPHLYMRIRAFSGGTGGRYCVYHPIAGFVGDCNFADETWDSSNTTIQTPNSVPFSGPCTTCPEGFSSTDITDLFDDSIGNSCLVEFFNVPV